MAFVNDLFKSNVNVCMKHFQIKRKAPSPQSKTSRLAHEPRNKTTSWIIHFSDLLKSENHLTIDCSDHV